MHSCKPGAPRPCDEALVGTGGAASLDPKPDQARKVRAASKWHPQRANEAIQECPKLEGTTSCTSQATRRRAKNGELREDIAKAESGKGRANASRLRMLEKHNARLEEQNARIRCIDIELKQLRVEIASTSLGPSRRRLRLERDALLAERELMRIT